MKQTLALKLGQQLTMTPQLQQAIRLLQLSALDLQAEINETLESNPLLEFAEDDFDSGDPTSSEEIQQHMDDQLAAHVERENHDGDVSNQLENKLTEDLPVDTSWEEVYPTGPSLSAPADSDFDPLANRTSEESLTDHLLWQLNLTPMAETDRLIASAIIDAIDPNGMLTQSTEDVAGHL